MWKTSPAEKSNVLKNQARIEIKLEHKKRGKYNEWEGDRQTEKMWESERRTKNGEERKINVTDFTKGVTTVEELASEIGLKKKNRSKRTRKPTRKVENFIFSEIKNMKIVISSLHIARPSRYLRQREDFGSPLEHTISFFCDLIF